MVYLSIVVPVLNEVEIIDELIKRTKASIQSISENFELIVIDDGSSDETWGKIRENTKNDNRVKGIRFSRNFGHHYAITAGLHHSTGDWVVVMDGDLQDRPEVIPELYAAAQRGFDIVFVSRQNRKESFFYQIAQKIFYWILRTLSGIDFDSRQANFSIINKKVVEAFKSFSENSRFYGSTIKWLGFKKTSIFVDHGIRFAGTPSYNLKKRFNLAMDIILSFSERPLKFAVSLGIFISFSSLFFGIWIIYHAIFSSFTVIGWASIIVSIYFSTGIILSVIGIVGIYIGQIFKQVKNRPLYIVSEVL